MPVTVLDHPLAHDLLAGLRDKHTEPPVFREHSRKLTTLLALEATKDLRTRSVHVDTPLERTLVKKIDQGLGAVPILRAGMAMLEPVLSLFADVKVGYIGLERDHETAEAHRYYAKLPDFTYRYVLCLDPMLATGGSASQAIHIIKAHGAERVVMVSVVASPAGIERLQADHPDLPIFTAALDRDLNPSKYILPGLGDYGDRLYGTF
jgi:uracil phosphoribosyltransferase